MNKIVLIELTPHLGDHILCTESNLVGLNHRLKSLKEKGFKFVFHDPNPSRAWKNIQLLIGEDVLVEKTNHKPEYSRHIQIYLDVPLYEYTIVKE